LVSFGGEVYTNGGALKLDKHQLRRARERLGYGVEMTAQEAGVSKNSVLRAEHEEDIRPTTARKIANALRVDVADLLVQLAPPGEAFFVPLEEGEDEDVVTFRFVRLFENGEEVVKAMRPAYPDEAHEMRQRLEKSGRSLE
jgi:DNA-binding XRE family transcriptional regulator